MKRDMFDLDIQVQKVVNDEPSNSVRIPGTALTCAKMYCQSKWNCRYETGYCNLTEICRA
ncbi:FDLD family class I lanthipeptide [Bacillus mobilis]|uniref:FDLD family class I lanthipeptide n=1 Tax=Bacillus mobilis TaxID=2026190 RepID=UPI002E1DD609|nr:FDLD family class I lanthipeptide [Bacillus mobilis]